MSFDDIATPIAQSRKDAKAWLHLMQTSTNNISTNRDFNCALNGYLAGYTTGANWMLKQLSKRVEISPAVLDEIERERLK